MNQSDAALDLLTETCKAAGSAEERRKIMKYIAAARDWYGAEGRDESKTFDARLASSLKALALSEVLVGLSNGKHKDFK